MDMEIDFRLKHSKQVAGGLLMELAPGRSETARTNPDAIFIDEDAFGFVEPCFAQHLPGYTNYGHWGWHWISHPQCQSIIGALLALKSNLATAPSAQVVQGIGYLFADTRATFEVCFNAMCPLLLEMITRLVDWLNAQLQRHDCLTLHGI